MKEFEKNRNITTSNDVPLNIEVADVDISTIPEDNVYSGFIQLLDKLGVDIGYLFAHKLSDGKQQIGIQAKNTIWLDGVGNIDNYATISLGFPHESGNSFIDFSAGTVSIKDSKIITEKTLSSNLSANSSTYLATWKKAQSGYYHFNNGLIINWGYAAEAGTDTTITYAKAFTSATSYAIVPTMMNTTNLGYPTYVKSRTASNFVVRRNDSGKHPTFYIAIGY